MELLISEHQIGVGFSCFATLIAKDLIINCAISNEID